MPIHINSPSKADALASLLGPLVAAHTPTTTHVLDPGGTDNMGASFETTVVDLQGHHNVAYEISVVNTDAIGRIYLKASNSAASWDDVVLEDGSEYIEVSSGVSFSTVANLSALGYRYTRLSYARTSGDGQMDVWLVTK